MTKLRDMPAQGSSQGRRPDQRPAARRPGKRPVLSLLLVLALSLLVLGCGGDDENGGGGGGGQEQAEGGSPESEIGGFAMINPASVSDADYGALGYRAFQAVEEGGIRAGHSENVQVPDAGRTAEEYIADGFDVIALHGGQFLPVGLELAERFPDVTFILESSGPLPDQPDNVWNIARAYYPPYYAMGALGAMMTETGAVGYLAGLEFPDTIKSANSFIQGVEEQDQEVEPIFTFTGDFYDNVKARQATSALIDRGADVLVTFNGPSTTGMADAVEAADSDVLLTSIYTDKNEVLPENFLFSAIFDFASAYTQIVDEIVAGTRTGELPMDIQGGLIKRGELYNVPDDVRDQFIEVWDGIASGEIEVPDPPDDEVTAGR